LFSIQGSEKGRGSFYRHDAAVPDPLSLPTAYPCLVLQDNQRKTVRGLATEVERLVPQSRSLMADLLLRELTAQYVAGVLQSRSA